MIFISLILLLNVSILRTQDKVLLCKIREGMRDQENNSMN